MQILSRHGEIDVLLFLQDIFQSIPFHVLIAEDEQMKMNILKMVI